MFRKFPNKDIQKKVWRIQMLRRSNAATPVPDKKKWSRKVRYQWRKEVNND